MKCYTTRGLKNLPGTGVVAKPIIQDPNLFIQEMYKRAGISRMKGRQKQNYELDYAKCREMAMVMKEKVDNLRPPSKEDD